MTSNLQMAETRDTRPQAGQLYLMGMNFFYNTPINGWLSNGSPISRYSSSTA